MYLRSQQCCLPILLLLANPHFPWEGELRFTEVHLTVPGEIDVYGAQLSGLPRIGIGFTEGVAWTHTVSAGKRSTAYLLTLDAEPPTTYLVDGEKQGENRDRQHGRTSEGAERRGERQPAHETRVHTVGPVAGVEKLVLRTGTTEVPRPT